LQTAFGIRFMRASIPQFCGMSASKSSGGSQRLLCRLLWNGFHQFVVVLPVSQRFTAKIGE
jgi:hypothetical protein